MNEKRQKLVWQAFKKLDKTGDGLITVEDLKGVYNVQQHKKFKSGDWTEEQCLKEFLDGFDSEDKDGQVGLSILYIYFFSFYLLSECIYELIK